MQLKTQNTQNKQQHIHKSKVKLHSKNGNTAWLHILRMKTKKLKADGERINPLRPNNDLSQTSHCNIKGVSVSEVMRIENKITPVKFY